MSHRTIKIPIKNIKGEEGSQELVDSAKMRPYLDFAKAIIQKDNAGVLKAGADLKSLKVEDRYLWRVASALKWAFADFDSFSARADIATIETEDDRKRLSELFALRPTQFCLLMKAILGKERMRAVMTGAVEHALQSSGSDSDTSGFRPLDITIIGGAK